MNRLVQLIALVLCFLGHQNLAYSDSDMDVIDGKRIYTQCSGCHTPGYHRTGPKHCGLMGRRAGSVFGFEFTSAMKNSSITWTNETLNQFLRSPLDMIPDTNMGFAGIPLARERGQLIAFLATLTDENPLCR